MMGGALQQVTPQDVEARVVKPGLAESMDRELLLQQAQMASPRDGAPATLAGLGGSGEPFRLPDISASLRSSHQPSGNSKEVSNFYQLPKREALRPTKV
jgi:hypothetical protein